jgi:uncharacterized protein (DUF1684 family)
VTGGPGPDDPGATLALGDWRRTVATLYAEVRRLAADDPAAALHHWRTVREDLYRNHPQSPVPVADRATFRALHFDHDPRLRFEVTVEPIAAMAAGASLAAKGPIDFGGGQAVGLPVSGAGSATMAFHRLGEVELPFAAGPRRLALFWMEGYAGGLFLPFRDATNDHETYGAGRYLLDGAKSADLGGDRARGTLILDFNFAYQPSCAFDPQYACPLAPPSNRLDLPIRAGERIA